MRVLSLSLSPYYFLFLQLLCTNMKKVAVQPSLQYKQVETKDSIKKTISCQKRKKKRKKRIMRSWWKKALTESIQRRNEPCKWNITARGWHTLVLSSQSLQARHFSNQCDIYKVAKMGHRNWSHNHCNWSDTKLSVFTTARAVLTELYTQVPSLSRTHTHTYTHQTYYTHSLSMCCIFCSLAV